MPSFSNIRSFQVATALLGVGLSIFFATGLSFDLSEPTAIYWDRTHLFLVIKSILTSNYVIIENLAFPDVFNFLYFPTSDFTQRLILFLLSFVSHDVIVISNLYYIIIVSLSFLLGYFTIMKFTKDVIFSLIGSLIFIFVPYLVIRSTQHDFLAAIYVIPLTFLIIQKFLIDQDLSFSPRSLLLNTSLLLSIGTIALSGIYYAIFSILTFMFVGCARSYLRSSGTYLRIALFLSAAVMSIVLIAELPTIFYLKHHQLVLPPRHFMEQSVYGIRFSDLLWTANQYLSFEQFSAYWNIRGAFEGEDFWPGLILSLYGLGFILFSPLIFLKRMKEKTPSARDHQNFELVVILTAFLVFILFFASVYGLGLITNIFFNAIRSQNRLSPYFTFALILILIFEFQRLHEYAKRVHFKRSNSVTISIYSAFAIMFMLNNYPFLGFLGAHQRELIANAEFQFDRQSINKTLTEIHESSANQILQLPISYWPEQLPINGYSPYNHLLFYIFDKQTSAIRWSAGMAKESASYKQLLELEDQSNLKEKIETYNCFGFDALLLEKRAYSDADILSWKAMARELDLPIIAEDSLRLVTKLPQGNLENCKVVKSGAF